MVKKIIALIILSAIAFSCVACGEQGESYKKYEVAVKGEKTSVVYTGKTLSATSFGFSDAETPERLYKVFGDYEIGSPSVEFSGKVNKTDDKIVVGVKVGDSPRLAGVYVKNYGFFFVNEDNVAGGEFAIALNGIPSGVFTFNPCAIVGDALVVGKTSLSFTALGAVVAEGEKDGDFTVYDGLSSLYEGDFRAVTDTVFAAVKTSVVTQGNVSAAVKGDAGIALGIKSAVVGDVSGAKYVYAGVTDGKLRLSEVSGARETVLTESEIAGYSSDEFCNISATVGNGAVTLTAGTSTVTADITLSQGNAGFVLRERGAAIKDAAIPIASLEEYKAFAFSELEALKKAHVYEVNLDGLLNSRAVKTDVDYSEDSSVKKAYDKAERALNGVTEIGRAQEAFDRYYGELEEKVVELYKGTISNNLEEAVEKWFSVMSFDTQVAAYYPSNERVSIEGMSFIIGVRTLYDDRWWIRDPFKPAVILSNALNDIELTNSKAVLDNLYEEYYVDILRAVFDKTFETYYAIKKHYDPNYDQIGIIWNLIWSYNNGNYDIAYDGPMKAYRGTVYKKGDESNPVRISGMLYNPAETQRNVLWLANDAFPYGLNILRTGTL